MTAAGGMGAILIVILAFVAVGAIVGALILVGALVALVAACVVVGTLIGDAIGSIGRGGRRAPDVSYWNAG